MALWESRTSAYFPGWRGVAPFPGRIAAVVISSWHNVSLSPSASKNRRDKLYRSHWMNSACRGEKAKTVPTRICLIRCRGTYMGGRCIFGRDAEIMRIRIRPDYCPNRNTHISYVFVRYDLHPYSLPYPALGSIRTYRRVSAALFASGMIGGVTEVMDTY